jgi:peptide/nickel transport system substrate-binding protein
VKFTLEPYMHPAVLWVPPGSYVVTVLDDKTYTITYHRRVIGISIPGEDDYTVYYPKHLLQKLDPNEFYNWDFWTHPVGNGPYRYVRHVPKTMMELEANSDYYQGKPRIERVLLKFGNPTASGAVTELLSNNVDVARLINPLDALKLRRDPRFHVYEGIYREQDMWVVALFWNQRHPALRDPKVRRALTLAIDRRELDQLLNLPEETPIFDVIFSERQFRRGELPQPLPYDPELAKTLLHEAGWQDQKGDGLRQQDGRPFRLVVLGPGYGPDAQAAVYVQAALHRVGVQVDLGTLDWDTVRQRARAGDFEAAILEMTLGECRMFFGELEIGDVGTGFAFARAHSSPIGYANPKVTALLKELRVTFNPDQEDRIYRQIWPILQADMPATFLCPFVQPTAARRRVRGLSSPWRADPVWCMDDLWLEDRGDE